MKRVLTIVFALALSLTAAAQRAPRAADFKDLCDTLSLRLKEKTGVESKLSVYRVVKNGRNLNLYFSNTLSDYPWHSSEQAWFKQQLSEELKTVTTSFGLGRILMRNNGFEELATPEINNDGSAVPYRITLLDPRNTEHNRFIEKVGVPKFKKGMSDRYIALWQSHGRYFVEADSSWKWQRAPLHRTVEDLFTQSFVLPYLIPMLENSGAYVMTPRERDTQWREYITDNDPSFTGERGPQLRKVGRYSEKGKWQSVEGGFADTKPAYTFKDNPFRNGTARVIECSPSGGGSATWTPNIDERGSYAVYISYKTLDQSSSSARYTVRHMGGESEFRVNQNIGGGTWIYLGTFEFDKGNSGCVILDNRGAQGLVVSADAVKIGGGMGKLERGGSTSGVPSYTEGAHYWMQWAGVDSTITRGWASDYTNDFASRGAWTEMMREEKGVPFDLALAFHSDAGITPNDSIVGTLAIYSYPWENKLKFEDGRSRMASRLLAEYVQDQVVSDIRADFEPEWIRRELWDRSYSESRTTGIPSMILETLSHQNFADMRHGLDPSFRFAVSRAVYKGMLKTLSAYYQTPYVVQPLPVNSFEARFASKSSVKLSWKPTPDPKEPTASSDSYIVYTRIDGGAFDSGSPVKGTEVQMSIKPGHIYSYKVVARNEGGISFPSEILSVGKPEGEATEVLIVNNFTRVGAPYWVDSPEYAGFIGRYDCGVPYLSDISFIGDVSEYRRSAEYVDDDNPGFGASFTDYACSIIAGNSFDYPYVHGKSLMALGYAFCSSSAQAFCESGASGFPVLDLICGKQKTTTIGRGAVPDKYQIFPDALQDALRIYAEDGGNLIVSGSNIGSESLSFTSSVLGFKCPTEFGTQIGKIGEFEFYNTPNSFEYCVEYPNSIVPAGIRSKTLLKYGSSGRGAAVLYRTARYRAVSIAVPIETVKSEKDREELLRMSLQALRTN